jgi:hypothetical protein
MGATLTQLGKSVREQYHDQVMADYASGAMFDRCHYANGYGDGTIGQPTYGDPFGTWYTESKRHEHERSRCSYCGSKHMEDSRGNCASCGAPL